MNLFVPCFDEFQAFIDKVVEDNPGDPAVLELQQIVDNGRDGMGVHQISGDGSNIVDSEEVFSIVQLHNTCFEYPEGFFDKWILVVTMNFSHTRMDVFCHAELDPADVYKQLQDDFMRNCGIKI